MFRNIICLLFVASFIGLLACSKPASSSPSVVKSAGGETEGGASQEPSKDTGNDVGNADGSCSDQFVSDYKSVYEPLNSAAKNLVGGLEKDAIKDLELAQNNCDGFLKVHGQIDSCQTVIHFVTRTILVSDVKASCERAAQKLSELRGK